MSHLRSPRYSSSSQNQSASERGWALKATYVEIYNEQLRDLLVPETVASAERPPVSIREDVKGNILLTGLRQVDINSIDDLMKALNFGSTIRQTDATAINAKSSRSHAVFSLNLVQRKSGTPGTEKRFSVPLENMTGSEVMVSTDSKLHFVDLAGSERLKNTGAQGERAKEGISINAGLAALGKVISQLSSRQAGSHVSYRDSKLTRLLQDSLGGNAITYMIACVTPAEFHLSETLNTVQYAQRARAIQSKPRIQQVEEGDKQALIDRLKAEVSYLREQIRSTERAGGDRRPAASERSDRPSEREVELQNQLLDSQETYTTLSQRHAKLIAEMAKARDNEAAEQQQHEDSEDIATERLNRSNSFAQAVEQVVLEYEKTIQSLEQSVSSTRTTLANTEASLLEKETKFAYSETINAQLQSRLQKLMDREANTENYLHDLESKLDGHTSGEEKNATIVLELRKEIARVKENEAGCEDYISTLEERLAEADQDAELMQREIDRLEQVVERQRSLGKLDSLLYELDNLQQDGRRGAAETPETNGATRRRSSIPHSRTQSHVSRHSHKEAAIPEGEEGEEQEAAGLENGDRAATPVGTRSDEDGADEKGLEPAAQISEAQSPAQTRYVADKLETVTQELVHLRVEHETTVNQYDSLHAKYEEALRNLADLQDLVDENRQPRRAVRDSVISAVSPTTMARPDSFMSEARSSGKDGRYSSSRSLDSELSSAMESPATAETSDAETATAKPTSQESVVVVDAPEADAETATVKPEAVEAPVAADASDVETATLKLVSDESLAVADVPEAASATKTATPESLLESDDLSAELARLKTLAAEKEIAERELADKYSELQSKHGETLDLVEELKTEVSKAKFSEASSPRTSAPVIRRKSSQNVMIIDRAHRSFASLRNLATENFEQQPDVMQNFELNLNSAMHELHSRSERIQELEAEIGAARKEMETKMTIISGLTRERSSLQASPRDMSVVSTLRDQLEQSEAQLKTMREAHQEREKELNGEVEALRVALDAKTAEHEAEVEASRAREEKIEALQADLVAWEEKHKAALDGVKTTGDPAQEEKIEKLQADLAAWEEKHKAALDDVKGAGDSDKDAKIVQLQADLAAWEDKHTTALANVQTTGDPLQEEKIVQLQSDLAEWEEKHRAALDGVNVKDTEQGEKITQLQADLALWEDKHKAALENLRTKEETMQRSVGDIEAQLAEANVKLAESQASADASRASAEVEEKHQNMVGLLQGELDEYKAIINSNAAKVAELETAHAAARSELDEAIKAKDEASSARDVAHGDAATQKELVSTLEAKIDEYEQAAKTHQEAMQTLQAGHAKELEELKAAEQSGYEEQVAVLMTEHSEGVAALEAQLDEARQELNKVATQVALALGVDTDVDHITERINELIADQKALGEEQKKRAELESNVGELSSINDTVMRDLEAIKSVLDDIVGPAEEPTEAGESKSVVVRLQGLKRHMVELESGSKKHSRLVEELEEQLAQNFDQAQATTNRLSTLQSERHSQLEEANASRSRIQAELDTAREEYAALQVRLSPQSTTT